MASRNPRQEVTEVRIEPVGLDGLLGVPATAEGLMLFAHGSGSLDTPVIGMNKQALAALQTGKRLIIVEGASHLFEEAGTLDEVVRHAAGWFAEHLRQPAERARGHGGG